MKKEILKIKNLTKYYGNTLGIKNLSLTLYENEIFGYIGPNGAGKSTTIRAIMNLINKTQGEVTFLDRPLDKNSIDLKELIGYLPSEIRLYDDFTVKEILDYHEKFYKKDLQPRRKELLKRLKVDENKKIEDLSLGNLKKVGIILAFMHAPKLLILDEATSGLDPIAQQEFYSLLLEEKKKGTTIFYSTHILSEITRLCDRVGIIKDGKLLKIENIDTIKEKNLNIITIKSNDIDNIIKELNIKVNKIDKSTINFKNTLSIDTLIKTLTKYKIEKLLIEEATLEDIFLHYYK